MTETPWQDRQMLTGIGKQCAACNQLDFLPFHCSSCNKEFCLEHRLNHGCEVREDRVVPQCPLCGALVPTEAGEDANEKVGRHIDSGCQAPETKRTRLPCSRRNCTASEAVPVVCRRCGGNFCFRHRFPSDHDCPSGRRDSSPTRSSPKAAASASAQSPQTRAEKLGELHKKASGSQGTLWRKVEVMRAKARAVGDERVPAERRVFFEVVFPFDSGVAPRSMFFDSNWTVGKTIDKIAEAGRIVNRNAEGPGAPKLVLIALTTGKQLDTRLTLGSLASVEGIQPGDPILLETNDILQLPTTSPQPRASPTS